MQEGNLDLLKELSETQKALERAKTSGKVKTGKLLYEVTISDESVPFSYAESALSDNAMSSLDVFAGSLIADNKEVYIEIQGHTDDVGSKKYNEELGSARAEAVKKYLHINHSIPLTRMGTISYGETMPVEKNDSHDNRAKNRRVILLVME
ncbi:OmpA family protein [Desulfobacterales bacterium HSG16]|nr:OmpA family protein [Desulfobacterales bacterium HSG16]